jgi:outer membrane protein assembly factor BamB
MLSTPAVGIKKARGLIWTIFSRVDQFGRGSFVCLNTQTGRLKYEIPLKAYSWVSPIAMYDSTGNAFIYFSDIKGNIFLIDGESGEIIFKQNLEYIFESSPIAIGNRIIQPARGNRILSFIIK